MHLVDFTIEKNYAGNATTRKCSASYSGFLILIPSPFQKPHMYINKNKGALNETVAVC